MDDNQRRDDGMTQRRKVLGNEWVDKSIKNRNAFNTDFQDLITRYAWGDIWTRPHFDHRTRRVLVIGTMVALGQWDEFRLHVRAALAEGLAFAESLGLDGASFLATARQSAAYSRVMDSKGPKMLARDFSPQSHIAQTLKDAELILLEAGRHGLPLPLTSVQAELLRKAIALEGPDCDSAAVIEAVRAGQHRGEDHS